MEDCFGCGFGLRRRLDHIPTRFSDSERVRPRSKMAAEEEGSEFIRLRSEDESFQRRSNFVFASLGNLEPIYEEWGDLGRERTEIRRENRSSNRVGRNARSRLPARVPDHVLSPEKWTEYSLKVDGSEGFRAGMSENNLNRHAAHSFLQNLRKRKAEEIEAKESHDETKISFKKPNVGKEGGLTSSELKGAWKDGTFVMPEYHAGVSRAKQVRRPAGSGKRSGVTSSAGCDKVSLGHLREDGVPEEESEKNDAFKERMKEVKEDGRKMVDKEDSEKNEEGEKEEG